MIRQNADRLAALSVLDMCRALGVSRATYYRPLPEPAPDPADQELLERIERMVLSWAGYGYRRVWHQLGREGVPAGQKTVRRLMKSEGLGVRTRRRWVRTTDSEHGNTPFANLVKGIVPTGPNQIWVSDITYVRLPSGFCYLAVILDRFSRKAIAWHLSRSLDSGLTLACLQKALAKRNPAPGWIHHSDRGVQYACRGYVEAVMAGGGTPSMSAKASPRENAHAESFFRTLKAEEVHLSQYRNFLEAESGLQMFIDQTYNTQRLHSSLGYLPPDEYETLTMTK